MNLWLIIFLGALIASYSLNSHGSPLQLTNPEPGAQEYEFAIYPDGVEKIIQAKEPIVDSSELPLGEYKYKLRIKKDNKWSPWSIESELSVAKKSHSFKVEKDPIPEEVSATATGGSLQLAPFLFLMSRSIEARNKDVKKSSSANALRVGSRLDSKYYSSEAFYETGSSFTRTDLGIMKTLNPYFQLGGRGIFASANFKSSEGSARINSLHAFIQASGKYETENNYSMTLTGGATLEGSFFANFSLTKSFIIFNKIKISPTIGYEDLRLRSSDTRLNSASILAGVFAEFPF